MPTRRSAGPAGWIGGAASGHQRTRLDRAITDGSEEPAMTERVPSGRAVLGRPPVDLGKASDPERLGEHGGSDEPADLQSLCAIHHRLKTATQDRGTDWTESTP
jgi:hypothetical protein